MSYPKQSEFPPAYASSVHGQNQENVSSFPAAENTFSNAPVAQPPGTRRRWAKIFCGVFCSVVFTVVFSSMGEVIRRAVQKQRFAAPLYSGCFNSFSNATIAFRSEHLTTFQCLEHCHRNGFKFAATANKTDCKCALDFEESMGAKLEDSECGAPCGGQRTDTCGGHSSRVSVYRLGSSLTVTHGPYSYTISPRRKTWKESAEYCQSIPGGHLAVQGMKDLETRASIMNQLIEDPKHVVVWIGATDGVIEGRWKWVNGEDADEMNWWWLQPDSYGGNEDCALITDDAFWSKDRERWHTFDSACEFPIQSVCEFKTAA